MAEQPEYELEIIVNGQCREMGFCTGNNLPLHSLALRSVLSFLGVNDSRYRVRAVGVNRFVLSAYHEPLLEFITRLIGDRFNVRYFGEAREDTQQRVNRHNGVLTF